MSFKFTKYLFLSFSKFSSFICFYFSNATKTLHYSYLIHYCYECLMSASMLTSQLCYSTAYLFPQLIPSNFHLWEVSVHLLPPAFLFKMFFSLDSKEHYHQYYSVYLHRILHLDHHRTTVPKIR